MNNIKQATPGHRLGGWLLELVLLVFTVWIGWTIWYLIVGTEGQSPAQRILRLQVVHDNGTVAGLGTLVLRWLVRVALLFGPPLIFGLIVVDPEGTAGTVGGLVMLAIMATVLLWFLWDKQNRCLWDIITRTKVIRRPPD